MSVTIFSDLLSEPDYDRYLHSHRPDAVGSGWRTIKGDHWTLPAGAAYAVNPAGVSPEASIFPAAEDGIFQCDFNIASGMTGTYGAWIPFRGLDTNQFCVLTAYIGTSNNVRLRFTTNGGNTLSTSGMGAASSVTLSTDTWYRLQIDLRTAGHVIWTLGPAATFPTGASAADITTSQFSGGTICGIGANGSAGQPSVKFRNVTATTEKTDAVVQCAGPGNLTVILMDQATLSGELAISGIYAGTPADLQYQVVDDLTSTAVRDWTTFDAAPSGGVFSAALTDLPKGGWYNLNLRSRGPALDGSPVLATSYSYVRFGVGQVMGSRGQSNEYNKYVAPATVLSSVWPTAVCYDGLGYRTMSTARAGDGAIGYANVLGAHYQCPVAFINGAKIGTSIEEWLSDTSTAPRIKYLRYVDEATLGVNRLLLDVWGQGEANAQVPGETRSGFSGINSPDAGLTDVHRDVRAHITGPAGERLLIFQEFLGRAAGGDYDDALWQAVREGQLDVFLSDPDMLADGHFGAEMANNLHLTNASYAADAKSMMARVLGLGTPPRGNYLSYLPDLATLLLHYDQDLADPGEAYSAAGWYVSELIAGVPTSLAISSVERHAADTVRIRLAVPMTDPAAVSVWSQYGAADSSGTAALVMPETGDVSIPDYDGSITTSAIRFQALPFSSRDLLLVPEPQWKHRAIELAAAGGFEVTS